MAFVNKEKTPHGGAVFIDTSLFPTESFSNFADSSPKLFGAWIEKPTLFSEKKEDRHAFFRLFSSVSKMNAIEIDKDIELYFDGTVNHAVYHLQITVKKGSLVKIIDKIFAKFSTSVAIHIVVEEGAKAQYEYVRENASQANMRFVSSDVHFGGYFSVAEYISYVGLHMSAFRADLLGEGAVAKMYGIFFGNTGDAYDISTESYHSAPHTFSEILSKGVLNGEAKAVHKSAIDIARAASKSEGYERQDTLLLSSSARIQAVPTLQIHTNDVRCSHGATVTRLRPEHLFYLLSRGCSREAAEKFFISGHVAPVLDKIK